MYFTFYSQNMQELSKLLVNKVIFLRSLYCSHFCPKVVLKFYFKYFFIIVYPGLYNLLRKTLTKNG